MILNQSFMLCKRMISDPVSSELMKVSKMHEDPI
jgi:hypothetical protein